MISYKYTGIIEDLLGIKVHMMHNYVMTLICHYYNLKVHHEAKQHDNKLHFQCKFH